MSLDTGLYTRSDVKSEIAACAQKIADTCILAYIGGEAGPGGQKKGCLPVLRHTDIDTDAL